MNTLPLYQIHISLPFSGNQSQSQAWTGKEDNVFVRRTEHRRYVIIIRVTPR